MLTDLKFHRLRLGLTQREVAERLKISGTYLSLMENLKEPIPQKYILQLAKLYNRSAEELAKGGRIL